LHFFIKQVNVDLINSTLVVLFCISIVDKFGD